LLLIVFYLQSAVNTARHLVKAARAVFLRDASQGQSNRAFGLQDLLPCVGVW
jgi:hypothetical protein